MPNPGQPTISEGARGAVVRRLQRALKRTGPNPLVVDGVFGPQTLAMVKDFQQGAGLVADGIVGPATWAALPDGGPMPLLKEGSHGAVVVRLQQVLAELAQQDGVSPGPADGIFGPKTTAAVKAFQAFDGLRQDGVVGDQTWFGSLHAAGATLESVVGRQFIQP